MKLLRTRPPDGLRRQGHAKLVLRLFNRVPDVIGQRDGDEQAIPFRASAGRRMAAHETSIVVDRRSCRALCIVGSSG
jgi:hypothetical protein